MTVLGGTALAGVLGGNGGNGGSPNGGGLLGGLFGGGNNNTCYVTEKEFYQNQLADTNIMYQNLMNTNSALCELSQRVVSDEVSIAKNFEIAALNSEWQQKMNDKQFTCVDEKMQWMDKFLLLATLLRQSIISLLLTLLTPTLILLRQLYLFLPISLQLLLVQGITAILIS